MKKTQLSQKEPEEWWLKKFKGMENDPIECYEWKEIKDFIRKVLSQQRTQTIEEIKSLPTYTFQPVGGISNIEYIRKIDIE